MLKIISSFIFCILYLNVFSQENFKYRIDKNCFYENVEVLDKILVKNFGKKFMNKKMKNIIKHTSNTKKDSYLEEIIINLVFDSDYKLIEVDVVDRNLIFKKRELFIIKNLIRKNISQFKFCYGHPYDNYRFGESDEILAELTRMRNIYEKDKNDGYLIKIVYPYFLNNYILNNYPFILNK